MKRLLLILTIFLSAVVGYGQYSPATENYSDIAYVTNTHIIKSENVKYDYSTLHNEIVKKMVYDSTQYTIIATGMGYSYTPNNAALMLLIINRRSSIIQGTYISLSIDDDKKFVSTLNLVLHGVIISRKNSIYIYPVIGINLYHVSVALQTKYYYGINNYETCSPAPYDDSNTIWDYDMTYALTFGAVTTFRIKDQTFGVPVTFTKHGFSTVGLLIKINRNNKNR